MLRSITKIKNDRDKGGLGKHSKTILNGALDGLITTASIVASVVGASLDGSVLMIIGLANLAADGLATSIGVYLSNKSEKKFHENERKKEFEDIENNPKQERDDMVALLKDKGLSDNDASKMMEVLEDNKEFWVDEMLVEAQSITSNDVSPIKVGLITFGSFAVFGIIPLLSYLIALVAPSLDEISFYLSLILTVFTLIVLGFFKAKITEEHWLKSSVEVLVIGGGAFVISFAIGYFVSSLG